MNAKTAPVEQYFNAISEAFAGLDVYLREEDSPLYKHHLIGSIVVEYLDRLRGSFDAWENHLGFAKKFRISRAESGFPTFQHVLELDNDRKSADKELAKLPDEDALREEMVDFILRKKNSFPDPVAKINGRAFTILSIGDRSSDIVFASGAARAPIRVFGQSENQTARIYVVHWG